jgi:hypothetical protein
MIVSTVSFAQKDARLDSHDYHHSPQFKKSRVIVEFKWIGDQVAYPPLSPEKGMDLIGPVPPYFSKAGYQVHGDTFPMTWADDDKIYTSAGDPSWGGKNEGLDIEKFAGMPPHYAVTRVNPMADYKGYGGKGPKPTGMICIKGCSTWHFRTCWERSLPPMALRVNTARASEALTTCWWRWR